MKKALFILISALAICSCAQETLPVSHKIAGTYVVANEFGAVYKIFDIGYGKISVTEGKYPLFFQDGTLYADQASEDFSTTKSDYNFVDFKSYIEYTYTYKDGIFTSDYFGNFLASNNQLDFNGEIAQRVLRGSAQYEVSPAIGWGLVYSPDWNPANAIPMTWERVMSIDGIMGWWKCDFTTDTETGLKLVWNNSWEINRGPEPNQTIYPNTPFNVIQYGENLILPRGSYRIYLSTDATKMVVYTGGTKSLIN